MKQIVTNYNLHLNKLDRPNMHIIKTIMKELIDKIIIINKEKNKKIHKFN